VRSAQRTLDLDLLSHGDTLLRSDELTLLHPRAHLRGMLPPLAEIDPQRSLPGVRPSGPWIVRSTGRDIEGMAAD
jgi:2-amino-4-hydroxy-6-hydroxymethyldihydropteridine diphosphokinase